MFYAAVISLACVFGLWVWFSRTCEKAEQCKRTDDHEPRPTSVQEPPAPYGDSEPDDSDDPEAHIEEMLSQSIPVDGYIIKGMSCLNWCVAMYDEELAIRIIREGTGVDVNEAGTYGYTPLHFAADTNMLDLAAALVHAKADLQRRNHDLRVIGNYETGGRTALHLAAIKGHTDMLKLLLDAGADSRTRDLDGNTARMLAIMHNKPACKELLSDEEQTSVCSEEHDRPSRSNLDAYLSRAWCENKIKLDRNAAGLRAKNKQCVTGVFRQRHRARAVWSAKECAWVMRCLLRVTDQTGWTSARHEAYATTDVQSCSVRKSDVWVRQSIRQRVFPVMMATYLSKARHPGHCEWKPVLSFRDLFFVKYDVAGQKKLDMHRDGSLLSLNILLNPATQFEGGGTYFEEFDSVSTIDQGDCLCHSGQLRHGGHPIRSGQRFILVGFIDVTWPDGTEYDPSCGSL